MSIFDRIFPQQKTSTRIGGLERFSAGFRSSIGTGIADAERAVRDTARTALDQAVHRATSKFIATPTGQKIVDEERKKEISKIIRNPGTWIIIGVFAFFFIFAGRHMGRR